MATFPSTSSHVLHIQPYGYDLHQLHPAVNDAIEKLDPAKGKSASNTAPTARPASKSKSAGRGKDSPPLFHIHTLTLDLTLIPPQKFIEYWQQAPEPNEEYEVFATMRDTVCTSIEALTRLPLMTPTRGMVRTPRNTQPTPVWRQAGIPSVEIFLPTSHAQRPLVKPTKLPDQMAKEWMPNSTAWDLQHWLQASLALDPDQPSNRKAVYRDGQNRVYLDTSLAILWVPDEEGETGIELKLIVTIEAKLDMTVLFDPLPDIGHDMLGLILHSLIPSPTTTLFNSESESRTAALRDFFSSLRSAPDHPFNFNVRTLQPVEMLSKLLPFQARTLAVLLQREGSLMFRDAKPASAWDPTGFWTECDFGQDAGRFAYRRVTGELTPLEPRRKKVSDMKGKGRTMDDEVEVEGLQREERETLRVLVDLSGVRGTMLCEEMGLGKTVEAIALILLHRHPLSKPRRHHDLSFSEDTPSKSSSTSRTASSVGKDKVPIINLLEGPPGLEDPIVKQWVEYEETAFDGTNAWDEEAQLHVTEIATTLVVTPPSLLKQWVAEMRHHAPSLRVCVYEGWKSLQKGIEKQHSASIRRYNAHIENKKRQSSEIFRRKTVNKYAKLNGGNKVKVEDRIGGDGGEYDNEVKEDVREETSLEICQRQFVAYVRAHDVVVTTYGDLSADLKVALPAPPRSRRSTANYRLGQRPRSPLIMVEWWRVIMDEVQLHGDQTDAANMVSLIPRRNCLAVSGTPAKSDVKDLTGSLKFLRVPVIPGNAHLWHRLQQAPMRAAFEGLFQSLAVRTTKKEVAGEFHLPTQSRLVVPIELSEIELHYYNETLERQRELLHLPDDGRPRPRDWVLDHALFRSCLTALRQICTHIQVGQMQAPGHRAERLHLGRELMTMEEALDKMRNDHSNEFLLESRFQMRKMILKAQLLLLDENDDFRHQNALLLYEKVRDRVVAQLGPVREHLERLLQAKPDTDSEDSDGEDAIASKHLSQQERDRRAAVTAAAQSIREMLIIQHQCWFFEGDLHHVKNEEDREILCYEQAEAVRKQILARPLQVADSSVQKLQGILARTQAMTNVSDLQVDDTDSHGGILSNNIVAQSNELSKILNGNAELVFHWRRKIIELLSSPIDSENSATTGPTQDVLDPEAEFYAEALKAQGDVEAYLTAYAAAIADRREFMHEERSILATHDARVTKLRTTKAAIRAVADVAAVDDVGAVSELTSDLMKERQAFRDAREHAHCTRPMRGLMMDLNAIAYGDNRSEEVAIAKLFSEKIRTYLAKQTKYVDELNKELEKFRSTFNRRVVYFAALQEISDSVSAPEFEELRLAIIDCTEEIDDSETKLARMTRKGRFLQYLGTRKDGQEELKEDCIICMGSSDDTHAILLACGHFFCLSCFRDFRRSVGGRKCPSCRADIPDRSFTKIKFSGAKDKDKDKVPVESFGVEDAEASQEAGGSLEAANVMEQQRRAVDLEKLRFMEVSQRREIALLDMIGEYGAKINFLIKHLLWFRNHEPDARHVIFSNWSDSLNIVIRALRTNGISFVSFDQPSKRKDIVDNFINDASISVFLLHAERESAGLTLTSCRVVHLLEPVLRHSFELQAIGRVDRLGQDKETTVYCYATMETVESRILSQGVRNGTSIYLKDSTADNVVASMPNVVSAAHKGGDLSTDGNEEELLKLIM